MYRLRFQFAMEQSIFGSLESSLFTGVVLINGRAGETSVGHRIPSVCQPDCKPSRYTLYEYQMINEGGILMLSPTPTSWQCCAPGLQDGLLHAVLHLCAGAGGIGIGATYLGAEVSASVDWTAISVEHLTPSFDPSPD